MADPLPSAPVAHQGVTIAAALPAVRYSLRTRNPDGLPAILVAAPFAGGNALGLGPDEWLLILPEGSPPPAIAGTHALTDISHRNVAFLVEGPKAAALIQCGVALDLSPKAFPVGKATRTLHEGVEIIVWRTGEAAFRIETWRSFADHLFRALDLTAGDL
ncbi:sarcosine oxidase subunit gamma [Sphingomonas profundi]|uniref:sarcosine oxidase subunit gamma n=1 Tax=Alterirhizorhabdus profundi TaxID=2681549 RepID=UPI0018D11AA6|nr:sarcosine oxidase subunit gamma family protein [Sphingomonas profundi]